jgi:hypothetical protein
MHRPCSTSRNAQNTNFILARKIWVGRHWVYSGHYPRIFIALKNAQNAESKHRPGDVPILLLAILALTTGTYSSLGFLQGLNPNVGYLKRQSTTQPHQLCHGWYKSTWKSLHHVTKNGGIRVPIEFLWRSRYALHVVPSYYEKDR